MDSYEKIKKSLRLEKVDEIPIYENFISLDIASKLVPDVISQEHISILNSDESAEEKNQKRLHLLKKGLKRELKVAKRAGIDALSIAIHPEVEWIDSNKLKTEFGRYYKPNLNLLGYGAIDMLSQRREGMDNWFESDVNTAEDILALDLNPRENDRIEMLRDFANSDVILIPELLMFQRIWSILGYEKFIDLLTERHSLLEKLLEKCKEYNLEAIDMLSGMGHDVFFYGDDFGSTTGGLIPIDVFREFLLPYMEDIVDECHEKNSHIILHSCGDVNEYFPYFVEAGFDAFHPMEPPWMDFEGIKNRWGDEICLIGNVDSRISLVSASKGEVGEETKRIIQTGQLEGHILSSSHSIHPGVKFENWEAMLEAASKYGKREWIDKNPPEKLEEWNQPTFNRKNMKNWKEVVKRRKEDLLQPIDVYLESKKFQNSKNKDEKVAIGTVATPHEAGREIISSCLGVYGYDVIDKGCITPENCINKLIDYDIVMLSMVKNPQAVVQGKVICNKIKEINPEIKIVVGGGTINRLLAEMKREHSRKEAISQLYKTFEIDGFGSNEVEAVEVVENL